MLYNIEMTTFTKLASEVQDHMGISRVQASKIARIYVKQVSAEITNEMDRHDEARKMFFADTNENHQKHLAKIEQAHVELRAYIMLRQIIGNHIDVKGFTLSIVTKIYIDKVSPEITNKLDKYDEAKRIFLADKANHQNILTLISQSKQCDNHIKVNNSNEYINIIKEQHTHELKSDCKIIEQINNVENVNDYPTNNMMLENSATINRLNECTKIINKIKQNNRMLYKKLQEFK